MEKPVQEMTLLVKKDKIACIDTPGPHTYGTKLRREFKETRLVHILPGQWKDKIYVSYFLTLAGQVYYLSAC